MQLLSVPTRDGPLRVAQHGRALGPGTSVVLAAHGLAANRTTWDVVARHLPGVCLLAPDLRGRGASAAVGPPYGITHHVDDLVAVLDHVGVDRATLAGSSMGCYVVATLARMRPDRVGALVLVDALRPRPMPADSSLAAALDRDPVVGGVLARIATTSDTIDGHRDLWRRHPAFLDTGIAAADIDAYSDADMDPSGPPFRSALSPDAVRADARSLRESLHVRDAADHVRCPVWLLRAPRGLRNEPVPFVPAEEAAVWARARPVETTVREVADTNHFSITLSNHGAVAVAAAIQEAVTVVGSMRPAPVPT